MAPSGGGPGTVRELLLDQRDEVAAVVDGVVDGVVAADEDRGDPDVDVVEQRLRDRLGRADEGGRVALRAARPRRGRPQCAVVPVGAAGDGEQPLRADVLRRRSAENTGPVPGERALAAAA